MPPKINKVSHINDIHAVFRLVDNNDEANEFIDTDVLSHLQSRDSVIGYTISYDRPVDKIASIVVRPVLNAFAKYCCDESQGRKRLFIVLNTFGHAVNVYNKSSGKKSWDVAIKEAIGVRKSFDNKFDAIRKMNIFKNIDFEIIDSIDESCKTISSSYPDELEGFLNNEYMECFNSVSEFIEQDDMSNRWLSEVEDRYAKYYLSTNKRKEFSDLELKDMSKQYLLHEIAFHVIMYQKYGINTLGYYGKINELVDISQRYLDYINKDIRLGVLEFGTSEMLELNKNKRVSKHEEEDSSEEMVNELIYNNYSAQELFFKIVACHHSQAYNLCKELQVFVSRLRNSLKNIYETNNINTNTEQSCFKFFEQSFESLNEAEPKHNIVLLSQMQTQINFMIADIIDLLKSNQSNNTSIVALYSLIITELKRLVTNIENSLKVNSSVTSEMGRLKTKFMSNENLMQAERKNDVDNILNLSSKKQEVSDVIFANQYTNLQCCLSNPIKVY